MLNYLRQHRYLFKSNSPKICHFLGRFHYKIIDKKRFFFNFLLTKPCKHYIQKRRIGTLLFSRSVLMWICLLLWNAQKEIRKFQTSVKKIIPLLPQLFFAKAQKLSQYPLEQKVQNWFLFYLNFTNGWKMCWWKIKCWHHFPWVFV